ncbi:MAG: ABC transporter ATP-binding protein [Chloroflexota bacterium]
MSESGGQKATLEASGLTSGYGGVHVLKALDFSIGHEIFAVLGANGAGKTTLMKTIAKILPLIDGRMRFQDEEVGDLPPHALAQRGLAFVPQENNIFPDMTVRENLSIGALLGDRPVAERMEDVFELFPDVKSRLDQKAGTLSGGESQMVAISRALMQQPRMLLLDEPTAGLAPKYVDGLFALMREIHDTQDVSIVLAEQNATKTLAVADRVMVLRLGAIHLIDNADNVDSHTLKEGYLIQ